MIASNLIYPLSLERRRCLGHGEFADDRTRHREYRIGPIRGRRVRDGQRGRGPLITRRGGGYGRGRRRRRRRQGTGAGSAPLASRRRRSPERSGGDGGAAGGANGALTTSVARLLGGGDAGTDRTADDVAAVCGRDQTLEVARFLLAFAFTHLDLLEFGGQVGLLFDLRGPVDAAIINRNESEPSPYAR